MPVIRLAKPDDLSTIKAIIDEAFSIYIPRIGKKPGPMLEDHASLIADGVVYCLEAQGQVIGTMVLTRDGASTVLDNLAVSKAHQGHGLGRRLLDFAETAARSSGSKALCLYTNEAMTENLSMYPSLGFVETRRAEDHGYRRVFFEKKLTV